ncbi:uncharacterized protein LOC142584167 [Dermacentor variabilis]|uniref:uncharacterized protein LOC142584167 n=1 Tax=Dermacentor variabilis TaxID=34621 RepID=UPI003F5B90CC
MNRRMDKGLRSRIKGITTALSEAGMVTHLYDTAIPSLDRCSVADEEDVLKLQDLASVFYLYAAFSLTSIIVFAAELLANRCAPIGKRARWHWRLERSVGQRNIFVRPVGRFTARNQ